MQSVNYCTINIDSLPERPGVYFLYENDNLLYIGRSSDIKTRIKNHVSVNKNINHHREPSHIDYVIHRVTKVEVHEYNNDDLPWIELFYICKLKPILNSETRTYYQELDQYLNAKTQSEFGYKRQSLQQYWNLLS